MEPTLVLCSHGTANSQGQEVIRRLAAAVGNRLPGVRVKRAVIDVEDHQLESVLAKTSGPTVVVPLLLSAGFHVHHDIATTVAKFAHVTTAQALGPDQALARLGVTRLARHGLFSDDRIVLAASGSSHHKAMNDVEQAALFLSNVLGRQVHVGHLGGKGTPLNKVVASLKRGHEGRVVVSTYLLAPGHFYDLARECGAHEISDPLLSASPETELIDLIISRYQTAAAHLPNTVNP